MPFSAFLKTVGINCGRWPKEVWLRIQNDGSLRWVMKAVLFDEEEEQHVR